MAQQTVPPTLQPTARPGFPPGPSGPAALRRLVTGPPTDFWEELSLRYPRLAHTRIGREHIVWLNHPETVRAVYVTQGRSTMKGRALQRAKLLLGEGLLTSEGELWRRQRRLVQPAFHHDRITRYAEQMVACAVDHERSSWQPRAARGETFDLAEDMAALTLAIVGRTLFDADLSSDASEVGEALGQVLGQFRTRTLPGAQWLDRIPTRAQRRMFDAMTSLDAVVQRLIDEHRRDQAAGVDRGDVLSMLLTAGDSADAPMADRQVRDEVMTLVLAGHETTANALTWAWYLLDRHPAAAAWLRAELAEVVGPDRAPRPSDVDRLPYTRAVVAETMRLYPPAWTLGRRLTADVEVDGWTLPEGTLVLASQWVLHRDPRFWPRARAFEPERWLVTDDSTEASRVRFDESAPGQPRTAWFPFGLGQRLCIGEPFAWTEAVLVLATLARRWAPHVPSGHVPEVQPAVTLRPLGGMPARLLPA